MREDKLVARKKKKFHSTTDSNHTLPVAANLLDQKFDFERPNQAWVGDITYIPTKQGFLYLAVLLDLFSRRVVGWAVSANIDTDLVSDALNRALLSRSSVTGLIHHTDRGSQYASDDYQRLLKKAGIVCSMSRRGNCYDNAVAESFFATLEFELLKQETFTTHHDAKKAIDDYISVFYNHQRQHSHLGYISPSAYERMNLSSARTT